MRASVCVVCVCLALVSLNLMVLPADAQQAASMPSGFQPRKDYSVGKGADGIEIGDINGDGKGELVVANRVTSNLSLFKQTGLPNDPLMLYQTAKVGWPPAVVAIADINQDGLNDVAVAHYDNYVGSGKTNTFGVCYQDTGTHLLLPETNYTFPSGQSSRAIATGDVNSDGKAEVVVANEVSGNSVFVWGWNSTSSKLESIGSYSGASPYVISITVGDVTGDGKNDVATYGSNLYVLEQDTGGKLKSPVNYGSTGGESGDVGDVNGDGLNDVAGSTAWSGEMETWLQTPSHTLKKGGTYTAGSYTEDTEIEDLNNDGRKDILTSSRDNSEAWLFLQDSTGNLSKPEIYVSIPSKWLNELAVGDLNNDGMIDFAGANWGEMGISNPQWTTVSIWIQNATGPIPPVVMGTKPANSATNISVSTNIEVTFSKTMNRSATEGAFSISPTASGTFAWSGSDTIMTFDPSADLANNTKYTVTISKAAKDTQGLNLKADYVFSFTTEKIVGPAPPTVVSTSPANGDMGVPVTTKIRITFSKAMDKAATESATSVSPVITWSAAWTSGDTAVTFTPSANLQNNKPYVVTTSTNAKSADGANLSKPYPFSFTTEMGGIAPNPNVTATDPLPDAVDVPVDSNITITFDVAMDETSTESAIGASPAISGSFSWDATSRTVTWDLASDMKNGTKYTVTITTAAKSSLGKALFAQYSFSFTTKAGSGGGDTTPPTITNTNPTNGSMNVSTLAKVIITFSEPMDASATEGAVSISHGSITKKEWNQDKSVLTLMATLVDATKYTVTVSTGARDVAGNTLAGAYTFSFTTVHKVCGNCGVDFRWVEYAMIAVVIVVIALILVVLLLLRKRKKKTNEAQYPYPQQEQPMYYQNQ